MAKMISTKLQQYWVTALETIPAAASQAPQNAVLVLGKKLTITSLLITLAMASILLTIRFLSSSSVFKKKNLPPSIPGFPLLGNLLQVAGKKPHRTFTSWAEKYGPIFSIKLGSIQQVVINSPEIAKEATITKFDAISSRKLPLAVKIITKNKNIVTAADYGDDHRMLRKLMVGNLLNVSSQKQNRPIREHAMFSILDAMFRDLKHNPTRNGGIDVREYINKALFSFGMTQIWGRMPDEVDCPELGVVRTWEIFDACVSIPLKTLVTMDWRDYFPAFKWVPNKSVEEKISAVEKKRTLVMKGLIKEQRKRIEKEGPTNCYADILLSQDTGLNEMRMELALWEPIITSSDTTLLTTEWIMFELANNPSAQERLYKEIVGITGLDRMVTEDDIPSMPYLNAVIKETLRKYPPLPLLQARYIDKDITLGGYDIPEGWQVLINVFGIHNDPKVWLNPENWDPDRVMHIDSLDLMMGSKDLSIMPFGAGKRICAGTGQAWCIISMTIASFVQHFKWALSPKEIENSKSNIEDTMFFTTHKLHPLECIITPRVNQRLK